MNGILKSGRVLSVTWHIKRQNLFKYGKKYGHLKIGRMAEDNLRHT